MFTVKKYLLTLRKVIISQLISQVKKSISHIFNYASPYKIVK